MYDYSFAIVKKDNSVKYYGIRYTLPLEQTEIDAVIGELKQKYTNVSKIYLDNIFTKMKYKTNIPIQKNDIVISRRNIDRELFLVNDIDMEQVKLSNGSVKMTLDIESFYKKYILLVRNEDRVDHYYHKGNV